LRFYEGMFLIASQEVQRDPDLATNTILATLKKHGCEVVRNERWNERKLAYPVKRCDRGTYFVIHFNAEEGKIAALRRDCQLSEMILRTMITLCPVPLEKLPPVGTGPKEEVRPAPRRAEEQAPAAAQARPPQAAPPTVPGETADLSAESIDAFDIGALSQPASGKRKGQESSEKKRSETQQNTTQLEGE